MCCWRALRGGRLGARRETVAAGGFSRSVKNLIARLYSRARAEAEDATRKEGNDMDVGGMLAAGAAECFLCITGGEIRLVEAARTGGQEKAWRCKQEGSEEKRNAHLAAMFSPKRSFSVTTSPEEERGTLHLSGSIAKHGTVYSSGMVPSTTLSPSSEKTTFFSLLRASAMYLVCDPGESKVVGVRVGLWRVGRRGERTICEEFARRGAVQLYPGERQRLACEDHLVSVLSTSVSPPIRRRLMPPACDQGKQDALARTHPG